MNKLLDTVTEIIELIDRLKAPEQWFPWVRWCFAHAIGGGVGGVLSATLGAISLKTPGDVANWATLGASLGIAQWFVLEPHLRISALWVLTSALGWSVFAFFPGRPEGWFIAGLAVGFLQWLFLRRKVAKGAFWWVPANAVAWAVAGLIASIVLWAIQQYGGIPFPISFVLAAPLGGLIGGLLIGFVLARMTALPQEKIHG